MKKIKKPRKKRIKKFIIYTYDIKLKKVKNNLQNYNTVKRRFYTGLKNLNKNAIFLRTNSKSMIITTLEYEYILDLFFKKFKKWIVAYKIITDEIYELN